MDQAVDLVRTVLAMGAVLSLIAGMAPMLWGQIRVSWITTALSACVTFSLLGVLIGELGGAGTLAALGVAVAGGCTVVGGRLARRRMATRAFIEAEMDYEDAMATARTVPSEREALLRTTEPEPLRIARTVVPDMMPDVRIALDRMDRFRRIADQHPGIDVAETRVLVDRNLPDLLKRYAIAADGVDDDELRSLAASALGTVIAIGRSADASRRRVSAALRQRLDDETRYIAAKTDRPDDPLGPVE
jgi:hypothetical protein